jgi:large subunit ribosomal protein L9
MKIVFIKDVPKVAKKSEIKEVADGYGAFLVKSGVATLAGSETAKKVTMERERNNALKAKTQEEFADMAKKLSNAHIEIFGKVSSGTHLFKGIRPEDIAQAIESTIKIIISPQAIKIAKPIKETGTHTVSIVQGTMHAELKLIVSKQ